MINQKYPLLLPE